MHVMQDNNLQIVGSRFIKQQKNCKMIASKKGKLHTTMVGNPFFSSRA
jgi:hypothetical protein